MKRAVILGLIAGGLWSAFIVASAAGWNPTGVAWDFTNTGQLGDSFGAISAFMASVAAFFAFRTYSASRKDSRDAERRSAEPTYINLLERRYDILSRVRSTNMGFLGGKFQTSESLGQPVIDAVAEKFRRDARSEESKIDAEAYMSFVGRISGLSNLFRFNYQITSYAELQFSQVGRDAAMTKKDLSYQLIRLFRAQLSDSELLLIALNCLYGPGMPKFKRLVERYSLLHNMNPSDAHLFGLLTMFEPAAFGQTPADRVGFSERKNAVRAD